MAPDRRSLWARDSASMYFTCTLGEAAALNERYPTPFRTVRQLLEHNAQFCPQNAAVGFFQRSEDDGHMDCTVYDFQSLRKTALHTAASLELSSCGHEGNYAVALVGKSTKTFLFAWLGLVALGYEVLLLSPDLEAKAIIHLCKECNTSILVYDPTYDSSVARVETAANDSGDKIIFHRLPDAAHFVDRPETLASHPNWPISEEKVAYYHHSSGTSGLPKLLPVTHKMAIGVLPGLQTSPPEGASFTTTPMYHGGPADCFRAWAGIASIWLYPGEIPITADLIVKCVRAAQVVCMGNAAALLAYFSCVPQVLVLLMEDHKGMSVLKEFQLVGVGGAAMPEALGDKLVRRGVRLLSRYGSTECGFLLSSHRSYDEDKDWMYLRHRTEIQLKENTEKKTKKIESLKFEPREDGLYELIALNTWPALAKTNRPDGSFATADLFKPHPKIANAWKYHSRADSQITLTTGKKFDPTLLEDDIRASPLLDDVFIFGNQRHYPGALLFPSYIKSHQMSDEELLADLWPQIKTKNAEYPPHAHLTRSMLRIVSNKTLELPKSSKGTTLRAQAEKLCFSEIESAYLSEKVINGSSHGEKTFDYRLNEEGVAQELLKIIEEVREDLAGLSATDDFYSKGVNSSDCMKINSEMKKSLLPPYMESFPSDIVYRTGNIAKLSSYLMDVRKGVSTTNSTDDMSEMWGLVSSKYRTWQPRTRPSTNAALSGPTSENDPVFLVTGATGALGAHIVSKLSTRASVREIHCLIRAESETAAFERLQQSLRKRQLPPIPPSEGEGSTNKVRCYSCKFSDSNLGLDTAKYTELADRVTHIIHAAWPVNFSMRFQNFAEDSIVGLNNLIQLAVDTGRKVPPQFIFCSSTASVIRTDDRRDVIPEDIRSDGSGLSKTGYAQSKWVAELICCNAHRKTSLHSHMSVVRIGQLCGDTINGVWNATEAFPLMIASSEETGSFPRLALEPLKWLPFDVAADAILDIAESLSTRDELEPPKDRTGTTKFAIKNYCRVYNLLSTAERPTTDDLVDWVQRLSPTTRIVTPEKWIEDLEDLEAEAANHPALQLLSFWKATLIGDHAQTRSRQPKFATEETLKASRTMLMYQSIREEDFVKMWNWIHENVGISK